MGGAEGEAWVTLATNDSYALGALVLAHSLRRVGTTRRLVALVTPGVTMAMRDQLCAVFDLVEMVNVLDSGDSANLALLSRPDLGVTFTKLHCWRLTQFSKCVFLDADTLVLQSCDELFEREELSAAPDPGWPDCFNSGVFVYKPSNETYQQLIKFAVSQGSFDGGDQGLLNSFFSDWATRDISRHLPFIYNMCSTSTYSYLPAYKKFGENVRIVHFIGVSKPWMQSFDSETRQVRVGPGQDHQRMLLQIWWDIFCLHVHPHLSIDMRHRTSLVPQLENSSPAHFVHTLFESIPMAHFEPPTSHFDDVVRWVQNTPSSNTPQASEPFACLPPNLPRDEPKILPCNKPESLPCNDQPGEASTDPTGGKNEPPCMEVPCQPQKPEIAPPAQPSPQQSSVYLSPLPVTVGMVEEQAERMQASLNSMENMMGAPLCGDPSSQTEVGNPSPETEAGLAAAFSQMVLGAPKTEQQIALEEHLRREAWETGQIDYLGKDSFENVWKKIMETLSSKPTSPSQPPPTPEIAPPKPEIAPQATPPSSAEPASVAPPPPPQQPPPPSPQPEVAPAPKSPPAQPPAQEPPIATPPPSIPLAAAAPAAVVTQQKPVTQSPKESVVKTPASPKSPPAEPSTPPPTSPKSPPAEPSTPPPTSPKPTTPSQPTPPKAAAGGAKAAAAEHKEAAAKQASAKGSQPAPGQAASEEGARGPAPVAPKRKGGSGQQQGSSGRGGKGAGQKGGKK